MLRKTTFPLTIIMVVFFVIAASCESDILMSNNGADQLVCSDFKPSFECIKRPIGYKPMQCEKRKDDVWYCRLSWPNRIKYNEFCNSYTQYEYNVCYEIEFVDIGFEDIVELRKYGIFLMYNRYGFSECEQWDGLIEPPVGQTWPPTDYGCRN